MRVRRAACSLALILATIGAAPAAQAAGFNAVASLDGIDVVCVGDSGAVFRSYDSGATFVSDTVGAASLRGVARHGLTLIAVGDGGLIWRSTDHGGAWSGQSPAGAVNLRAVAMTGPLVAYAVGDSGTILKSDDGGATWTPQVSGVSVRLNAVKFTDDQNGWVVGAAGTVLRTIDGGASWNPVVVGTPNELLAVDVSGSTVWVSGVLGTCRKSDGGFLWEPVNLRLDAQSDVRAIHLGSPSDVWLGGGGGFIRRSQDGGATWAFPVHALQKPLSDLCFVGDTGWATARGTRAVLRTSDLGATWSWPTGTVTSRSWSPRRASTSYFVRGSTLALNPVHPSTMYAVMTDTVFRSRDDGETWAPAAVIPNASIPNAFIVSPKDSNVWIAAVANASGAKRLVKTIDGGANWSTTRTDDYGDYGIPLEMHPDRPDTIYFGADNDVLYRSTDFGGTWAPHGATAFRSPCDLIVVPESDSAVIQVGDGITGAGQWELWRSNDGGALFQSMKVGTGIGSETPGMACSRLRPSTSFATHWPTNGIDRSTDGGLTWTQVHPASSAWGIDIARDDPNCVALGIYANGRVYLALDGGEGPDSFEDTGTAGFSNNYSFLVRDRATILAYVGNGIYKLDVSHDVAPVANQALTLLAPDGGESWEAGSVHDVTWNATNVGLARIEYRIGPSEPWVLVAEVAGTAETYAWTIPATPTATAEVRVRDAWDDAPEDVSNAVFTITDPTVGVPGETPASFAAWPSEPNPFGGSTRIRYALPRAAEVTLEVYNVQGRRVATLVRGLQEAGVYSVRFGPGIEAVGGRLGALPSGVYFYRLSAGPFTATRKMLLLR